MSTGWRIPIRVKLLAVLAVPVLGYVVIASMAVLRAQRTADDIGEQASVVTTAVGPTSLTTSLIDERTITSLERAGLDDELTLRIESSTAARRATDAQLSALQTLIDENPHARAAYAPAVEDLATELEALRADIDGGNIDDADLFARYSEFIFDLTSANESALDLIDDRELWQGAKLSELATRQKDARATLIDALIPIGNNEGAMDREQTVAITRAASAYDSQNAALEELANGPYARAGSVLFEALEAADISELAQNVLETGELNSQELYDVASYQGGFVYDSPSGDFVHDNFRATVADIVQSDAAARSASAARSLRVHLLAGTVGLVVTALVTWIVSRSITRPLRSLTRQAIETADHRLPDTVQEVLETPLGENVSWPQMEPIEVSTSDEVADVARALNTMQDSALGLAVEEAILRRHITDILVSLGQRNQNLLTRQLDFITDLERDEADPDVLANLFYLDHLATRMRRNAESLLVLAGIDPPRKWVGPTAVGDIVRAALGEAREYRRVRVHDVEPATIAGSATTELSHLLSELIENALVFSASGQVVEVSGHHFRESRSAGGPDHPGGPGRPDGHVVGGYRLTVTDAGVGMSPDELEQANRRLAGTESYTIAPSKYMGHYVAGKLAARNDIRVRLHSSPGGRGITAIVDIPASLLTDAPADRTQLPPLPATGQPPAPRPVPVATPPGRPAAAAADNGTLRRQLAAVPDTVELPEVPEDYGEDYEVGDGYDEPQRTEHLEHEHLERLEPLERPEQPERRERRQGDEAPGVPMAARAERHAPAPPEGSGRPGPPGGGSGSGKGAGGTGQRKARKPRKRVAPSTTKLPVKLPVPPASQPLESSSDTDQAS